MNERIKLLAEQARKHFPKTEMSGEFWVFDEEKFAELIVRECADIATMNQFQWHSAGGYVLKHFGIEK